MQTFEGGFIVGGYSNSEISGNKTEDNIGNSDYWVIKLYPEVCISPVTYYIDNDEDGFGSYLDTILARVPIEGYVTNVWDCGDTNAEIYPGTSEICNGIDDNCNFFIDDGLSFYNYYLDDDNDGFGNILLQLTSCINVLPSGYSVDSTDCDDTNNMIHPGGIEICNTIDDNCNVFIDEGLTEFKLFNDDDNDNYGNLLIDTLTCLSEIFGFVIDSTDCDDSNPNIYPGAVEIQNTLDDNCNDIIDEGFNGIVDLPVEKFQLFPNPNIGEFEIVMQNLYSSSLLIKVFNLMGEIVYSKKFEPNEKLIICLPFSFNVMAEVAIYINNIYLSQIINVLQ